MAQGVCVGLGPGSPPSSATPPVPGWTLHRQSPLPSSCPRDQVVDCKQQQRSADFKPIPVVVGRRRSANLPVNYLPGNSNEQQTRPSSVLIPVTVTPATRIDPSLPILYVLNATSLAKPNALQMLHCDLISHKIDICIITETWFKSKHDVSFTSLAGYILYRRDREGRKGGGVAIYVRENLCPKDNPYHIARKDIELLWIQLTFQSRHFIIGAVYHPPKPKYQETDLLLEIEFSLTTFSNQFQSSVNILCGDFNQLPDASIRMLGLHCISTAPTHAGHYLDRIYCSDFLDYKCYTVNSVVQTKHKAIIASNCDDKLTCCSSLKRKLQYRSHTPTQNAAFISYLSSCYWNDVIECDDVQSGFDLFYAIAHELLDQYYPQSSITVGERDPSFVTPLIKKLLRKRNKLMRSGKIEKAEAITQRVSQCVISRCQSACSNLQRGSKQMWDKVREIRGKQASNRKSLSVNISDLNRHYASISTDPNYTSPNIKHSVIHNDEIHFSEYEVFTMLDKIKPTATGLDKLPAWFIHTAAPFFSQPLTYLFNLSISQSKVPSQWKISSITPVPKVSKPQSCQDYRPISITSVLSRAFEKGIVRNFIYPSLSDPIFSSTISDQFAFRPSGSTTAALIYLMYHLTNMIDQYDYVHLIALDFSKAFDTVRHSTLLQKTADLCIDDQLYNWIAHFLSDRQHLVNYNGENTASLTINSSIIQGSGIGPVLYIISASDLHPIGSLNIMFKYADDTYLLVPSVNAHLIPHELQQVSEQAASNNLNLNISKSSEIIFTSYQRRKTPLLATIPGISRSDHITILGVVFSSALKYSQHVYILSKAASTMKKYYSNVDTSAGCCTTCTSRLTDKLFYY